MARSARVCVNSGGAATALVALFLGTSVAAQEKYLHTDSIGSQVVETTHTFHCETNRLQISFVERRRVEDPVRGPDRWRTILTGLTVSGRSVPAADMRALEARLFEYAWIERVTARCTQFNREIYVTVSGKRAEEWSSLGEPGGPRSLESRTLAFVIKDDGAIGLAARR